MKSTHLLRKLSFALGLSAGMLPGCDESDGSPEPAEDQTELRDIPVACDMYMAEWGDVLYENELLITNKAVTDDSCRTNWNPVNCNGNEGKFTAWYLFSHLRGTSSTEEVVHRFFETFDSQQVVNGTALKKRDAARTLLNQWRKASGCAFPGENGAPAKINWDTTWVVNNVLKNGQCALKKEKAPFRLLAVANRMDVRSNDGGFYGSDSPFGEGRLIYGFVPFKTTDPNPLNWLPDDLGFLDATLIFEYNLPAFDFFTVAEWAELWHDLGSVGVTTTAYRQKLQYVVESFVRAGLSDGPNNGVPLARVRTNEIAFDQGSQQWSLREYTLQCLPNNPNCSFNKRYLLPSPVSKTPNSSFNLDHFSLFDQYLSQNWTNIVQHTHDVPPTFGGFRFLGAESLANPFSQNPAGLLWGYNPANQQVVQVVGAASPMYVRHMFGIGTCIGCHYNETDTNLTMIKPRKKGASSAVAEFLKTPIDEFYTATIEPKSNDPNVAADWMFDFTEPRRRVCELIHALGDNPNPLTLGNGKS